MSVIDPRSKINVVNQSAIIGGLNAQTGAHALRTVNSNYVNQISSKDFSLSNITASQNYAYQYDQFSNIQKSLRKDFSEYQIAKDNINSVKEKIAEIKSLVKSAAEGSITGSALDDAQETINNLVSEINGLVDITKIGDKKVFDGNFEQKLQEDLSGKTGLSVDFRRTVDTNRPLAETASLTPTNDHESSLQVLFANEKYIVAGTQNDSNGEPNPTDFGNNGSVQIYDAVTKQLIREIQSPLTNIDNERFGYTVSVDGDKILIGTRNQGWWDGNNDGNNDYPEYDRDFTGGAFLYDIPSGNLITSFTKESLAAKNPLVDLGLKSENDVAGNNNYAGFGDALQIKGDKVYIYKSANGAGLDSRPNGQGALAATGIMEFNLDGTFVKQHNISVDNWQNTGAFQVTDDFIVVANGLTSSSGYTRNGSVSFLDKGTGELRTLRSPSQGNNKSFGFSADIQGNKLIVGESAFYRGNVYAAGTTTLIGYQTTEGYVDLATWNSRQNNGGSFNGFGGAVHLYNLDDLMAEYDTAYNAAITAGQTTTQAAEAATVAISSTSADGYLRSFDKDTLAAQGINIDTYDEFGYKVKLDGTNAVIRARLDDDTGVNAGATYVFDTETGELVTKAQGINFHGASGTKIYQGSSGTTVREYDFSSVLGSPTYSIDLDTNKTKAASLGARSSASLSNISISANIASLGGNTGLATSQTVSDIEAIEANIMRMESNFSAITNRVSNSLDRVGSRMEVLRQRKDSVDLKLSGYFNEANLPVQAADRRKALNLLP